MSKAGAIRSSASAKSLQGCTQQQIDRFYCDNFVDLMGEGLAKDLRRPKHLAAA